MSSKSGECVRVMVRIRPISQKEKQENRKIVSSAHFDRAEVVIANPDSNDAPKTFTFDAAFPDNCTQQQVYDTSATEIVEAVMNGYNGTIFAYGQTGAGKSHTMEGYPDPPDQRGIIPNSFLHIFNKVSVTPNKRFLVRASYLEIYNEEIRDLLSKDPKNRLELKENVDTGVYVKDLTTFPVKNAAEIDRVMQIGKKNRSVGATAMNQTSSRSHSIFTIVVECAADATDGTQHICMGKLNLVDLAGSERQTKTGATGDRLKEATKINLSLSALGNVISALVDGKSQHIPYRDSKLTRLLQDSLGGNTKTVMIANCGPADYNYEETITTLRYASRAKNIKNKPKINEDPKDAMLREFEEEINALRAQLEEAERQQGNQSISQTIDGKTIEIPLSQEIVEVEKIIEKVVIQKGADHEKLREKQKKEKEEILKQTKEELEEMAKKKAKAEYYKKEVEINLQNEHRKQEELLAAQNAFKEKLKMMEAKLLQGGQLVNKANRQEEELRKKKLEMEERKKIELQLARELGEKEEANLMIEEQYHNLQEELEAKTKKLKKVWAKVKDVQNDIKAAKSTYEKDQEDVLETIRELAGQLKLDALLIEYFIPRELLIQLEELAKWDDENNQWQIPNLQYSGNRLHKKESKRSMKKQRGIAKETSGKEDYTLPYVTYTANDEDLRYVVVDAKKYRTHKTEKRRHKGVPTR